MSKNTLPLPSGYTKIPWGYIHTKEDNRLVAEKSFREMNARAELGEFAIGLLGKLGLSESVIETLSKEEDPLMALQKIQQGIPIS